MAVQNWGVSGTDLTRVVQDNDLSVERSSLLSGVVLGVGANVSTPDVLDRDVLDVESDVVTGETLGDLLVVHFDGLDFSGDVGGAKLTTIPALMTPVSTRPTGTVPIPPCRNETSQCRVHSTSSKGTTYDLVDVLEGKSEGLVGRSDRGLNGVDGLQEGLTLDDTGLGLLGPSLVPGHVGGLLQHVVSVPSGDGDEGNGLGVVTDLLDETGSFLDDFVVSVLGPL